MLATTTQAAAQERAGAVYVGAGIAFPQQDGAKGEVPSQTYLSAPGGLTLGWLLGGGVFVTSWVSVDVELSSTGVMRAREPSRYGMVFNDDRRDRFYALGARFHVSAARRIDFEPVVGLVFARGTQWTQTEYHRDPPQQSTVGPVLRTDLPTRRGLAGGLDVRLGGPRIAVVVSFRVHHTSANDDLSYYYPGGFPEWTIHPGLTCRLVF